MRKWLPFRVKQPGFGHFYICIYSSYRFPLSAEAVHFLPGIGACLSQHRNHQWTHTHQENTNYQRLLARVQGAELLRIQQQNHIGL